MTFNEIETFLTRLAPLLELSAEQIKKLTTPEHVHETELEIDEITYPAYRVQFNSARGPYKGGIRFHPKVDRDEVASLAFWMSVKTAIANIPLGGGKGGVAVNPKEMTPAQLEALSRAYVKDFYEHLGPTIDIPAPDVYTNAQIMAWMLDEFENIKGEKAPGMITGKPLEIGGSLVRDIATALGGVYILEEAIKQIPLPRKTVAIQGFGNAGAVAAKLLKERGFSIVAISDSKGAIYNPQGIDVERAAQLKQEKKRLANLEGIETLTNEQLLELDVDVLIPAALENQITKQNANDIKAKVVLELANGPTTIQADDVLAQNGTIVIPDVLANSGGVTVSYFEWVQNTTGLYWKSQEVKDRLKEKMVEAFEPIWEEYKKERAAKITLRTAAYLVGLSRIIAAMRLRGSF